MFNVAVLRLKDITRYLFGIVITIIIVMLISKYFTSNKNSISTHENKTESKISKYVKNIKTNIFKSGISQTIPAFSSVNEDKTEIKQEENKENKSIMESLLTSEINIMKEIDKNEAEKNIEETNENTVAEENQTTNTTEIELAKKDVKTEVVNKNHIT